MKPAFLTLLILSLMMSCAKPSYKKNTLVNPEEAEPASSVDVFFEVPKYQKLTADQQIISAVMAAPAELREGAKVYGYGQEGEFMTIREGTNDFICIADNPNKEGFQVVGYHKSLEPMMQRGRELDAEGVSRDEKEETRSKEAEAGTLSLPQAPATLHIYYGENAYFDLETNQVVDGKYRYVIYIPYATQDMTGLALAPNESSHPWLMFPGKYNAHIMVTPTD